MATWRLAYVGSALIGAVVVFAACSDPSAVRAPAPESVIGCYALTLGKWSAARDTPDPPKTVVLLDSTGSYLLEKGRLLVRPYPLDTPMPFDMAWWTRLAPEHLDMVFTDGGYVGLRLHLVWGWGDATWRGTAEAFTERQAVDTGDRDEYLIPAQVLLAFLAALDPIGRAV